MTRILDLAIGTVFVFLLFSLIVTAANEIWLSLLDKRAAFLREGLGELLHGNGNLVAAVLNHGLVSSMSRGVYDPAVKVASAGKQIVTRVLPAFIWRKFKIKTGTEGVPSYIPGKSFVLAIISLLPKASTEAVEKARESMPAVLPQSGDDAAMIVARIEAARRASAELRANIEALPASRLRASFLALYDDAKGDLDRFKANLENWFNESMDRVGGWYKRYAQQWLFTLALVLAVTCNVDSIRIIRAFSANPKLVENAIAQAEKYLDANPPVAAEPDPGSPTAKTNPLKERVRAFNDSVSDLGATGIPIGWNDPEAQELIHFDGPFPISGWLAALGGWLLTALAASLGAPFWFDTLNRFMDIRGVGRAPEEKDSTAPKRRATGAESYLRTGDSKPSGDKPAKSDAGIITLRVEQPTAAPKPTS